MGQGKLNNNEQQASLPEHQPYFKITKGLSSYVNNLAKLGTEMRKTLVSYAENGRIYSTDILYNCIESHVINHHMFADQGDKYYPDCLATEWRNAEVSPCHCGDGLYLLTNTDLTRAPYLCHLCIFNVDNFENITCMETSTENAGYQINASFVIFKLPIGYIWDHRALHLLYCYLINIILTTMPFILSKELVTLKPVFSDVANVLSYL